MTRDKSVVDAWFAARAEEEYAAHTITNSLPMNANSVNELAGHVRNCTIAVWWSKEDDAWLAAATNLPGCVVHGDTIKHAAGRLEGAIKDWLDCYSESNGCEYIIPNTHITQPHEEH
jgi:predicted RNase H-like HicB family nuclease